MSNKLNKPIPPMQNPQLITILRIHVANFLASRHGVQNFTRDCIDDLVSYVYQSIARLILHIKSILMGQGRTIPNFLHVLAFYQMKNEAIDSFLVYLISRVRNQQHEEKATKKYQIKNLLKVDKTFPLEVPENEHQNIFSLPQQYAHCKSNMKNPLPIHKMMDQNIMKPPFYSYAKNNFILNREIQTDQIVRQSNLALNDMKIALGKQRKIRIQTENKEDSSNNPLKNQRYSQKMLFQMCKFL